MTEQRSHAPGWYLDPHNTTQLRWWDGVQWLDHYAPMPAAPVSVSASAQTVPLEPVPATAPVPLTAQTYAEPKQDPATFTERAQEFLRNPLVHGAALGAAGAALTTAGAVSLKKNQRTSLFLLFGLLALALGLFMLLTNAASPAVAPGEATVTGTVTKIQKKSWLSGDCIPTVEFKVDGEVFQHRPEYFRTCTWQEGDQIPVAYDIQTGGLDARLGVAEKGIASVSFVPLAGILTVVGLVVTAWAGVALAVRAGSVLGGIALFFAGFQRATRK